MSFFSENKNTYLEREVVNLTDYNSNSFNNTVKNVINLKFSNLGKVKVEVTNNIEQKIALSNFAKQRKIEEIKRDKINQTANLPNMSSLTFNSKNKSKLSLKKPRKESSDDEDNNQEKDQFTSAHNYNPLLSSYNIDKQRVQLIKDKMSTLLNEEKEIAFNNIKKYLNEVKKKRDKSNLELNNKVDQREYYISEILNNSTRRLKNQSRSQNSNHNHNDFKNEFSSNAVKANQNANSSSKPKNILYNNFNPPEVNVSSYLNKVKEKIKKFDFLLKNKSNFQISAAKYNDCSDDPQALEKYFIQEYEKDKNDEMEREHIKCLGEFEDESNYFTYNLYNLSNYSKIFKRFEKDFNYKFKVIRKSDDPYLNQQLENDMYVKKLKNWEEKNIVYEKNTKENDLNRIANQRRSSLFLKNNVLEKNNLLNNSNLNNSTYVSPSKKLENLNWESDLKKKIQKIKQEYKGKHFKDFMDHDKEEAAMFIQTIGLARKKFGIVVSKEVVDKCFNKNVFATFGIILNGVTFEEISFYGYYQTIINRKVQLELAYRKE